MVSGAGRSLKGAPVGRVAARWPFGPPLTDRPAPEAFFLPGRPQGNGQGVPGPFRAIRAAALPPRGPRPVPPASADLSAGARVGCDVGKRCPGRHPETGARRIATWAPSAQRPTAVRGRAALQIATGAPSAQRLIAGLQGAGAEGAFCRQTPVYEEGGAGRWRFAAPDGLQPPQDEQHGASRCASPPRTAAGRRRERSAQRGGALRGPKWRPDAVQTEAYSDLSRRPGP